MYVLEEYDVRMYTGLSSFLKDMSALGVHDNGFYVGKLHDCHLLKEGLF
jgi:hypothetical protein